MQIYCIPKFYFTSFCQKVCPSTHQSVHLFVRLSIYPSKSSSIYNLSIDLFNHNQSICVFIYLSRCLSFVYPSIRSYSSQTFCEWAIKEKTLYVWLWKTNFKHKKTHRNLELLLTYTSKSLQSLCYEVEIEKIKLFQALLALQLPKMFWRLWSKDEWNMWRHQIRPKPAETTARPECMTALLRYEGTPFTVNTATRLHAFNAFT